MNVRGNVMHMKVLVYFIICLILMWCFYYLDNNSDIVHSVLEFMASEA